MKRPTSDHETEEERHTQKNHFAEEEQAEERMEETPVMNSTCTTQDFGPAVRTSLAFGRLKLKVGNDLEIQSKNLSQN